MTMRLQSPLTHSFTIFEKIQPFIFQLSKLDQVFIIYSFSSINAIAIQNEKNYRFISYHLLDELTHIITIVVFS